MSARLYRFPKVARRFSNHSRIISSNGGEPGYKFIPHLSTREIKLCEIGIRFLTRSHSGSFFLPSRIFATRFFSRRAIIMDSRANYLVPLFILSVNANNSRVNVPIYTNAYTRVYEEPDEVLQTEETISIPRLTLSRATNSPETKNTKNPSKNSTIVTRRKFRANVDGRSNSRDSLINFIHESSDGHQLGQRKKKENKYRGPTSVAAGHERKRERSGSRYGGATSLREGPVSVSRIRQPKGSYKFRRASRE